MSREATARPPGHQKQPALPFNETPAYQERLNAVEEHFEALAQRDIIHKRIRALTAA